MTTIVDFLEARISEDESELNQAFPRRAFSNLEWAKSDFSYGGTDDYDQFTMGYGRALAECAAKRAILGMHRGESWSVPSPPIGDNHTYVTESDRPGEVRVKLGGTFVETISRAEFLQRVGATKNPPSKELRAIAAVYADHPDYRQEWAV